MKHLFDSISDWVLWAISGVVTSVLWLVRRVLTNEKEIELMKKSLENTDASVNLSHKRIDQQHEESISSRKELKTAIDKQGDAISELLRYLRDNP